MKQTTGLLFCGWLLLSAFCCAQQPEALVPWQTPDFQAARTSPPPLPDASNGPVSTLYRSLRSVGLDVQRTYKVREAVIDRGELHLYLNDGTISFTKDVEGRVTGAYFEGSGEVLLRPPDLTERASLGLFTGLGLLNEGFHSAYFRFNDDLMRELQPHLREMEDAAQFVNAKNETALTLASMDSLRLTESFISSYDVPDRYLHARMGTRLGAIDLYYDSLAEDQNTVGQVAEHNGQNWLDVWMAFPSAEARREGTERVTAPAFSSKAVHISSFRIDASLEPPEAMDATAELDMEVHTGGQRLLHFEMSRWLQVSSISSQDGPLEFLQNLALDGSDLARRGNDLVSVVFPKPLKAGQHITLRFKYSGKVMQQAAPGLLYVGDRGTWYPNRGIDMSQFTLKFRWPKDWTLVASGKAVRQSATGEISTGEWTSDGLMTVAGFNLGKFTRESAKAGNAGVFSYASSSLETSLTRASAAMGQSLGESVGVVAQRSARDIATYEQMFGPFPYESLSVTQFPGPVSQGWPTLVYLSSLAYLPPADQEKLGLTEFQRTIYSGFMQDHETAHQWWGDLVSWRSYRDQWLMEGLANFSAYLLMEKADPERAKYLLDEYRKELLVTNRNGKRYTDAGPVTLGYRLSSSVFPNAYVPLTYGRGLWLLVMLRDYFRDLSDDHSDAQFMSALRAFRERYERKATDTSQFQHVLEEFLPVQATYDRRKSLDWFFDSWVRGSSIPTVTIDNLKLSQRAGATYATFMLRQKECPDSLITSVPIYAELKSGERVPVKRVFADGNESRIEMKVPTGTKTLVADPEARLLRMR